MKKKNNNSVFYAGITVIIVVASFLYTWKFIIPNLSVNKAKSAELDTSISGASKKLDSLKKAQTTMAQLGDIPTQLSVAVPADKDMPNLITELEAVTAKYKIILPTISVSDGTGNAVTIGIAVSGSYDDIKGIIADLEKDVRFMNIKSVSISSSQDAKGGSTMSASLQIEAYKRGAAVPAAAALPGAAPSATPSAGE